MGVVGHFIVFKNGAQILKIRQHLIKLSPTIKYPVFMEHSVNSEP